MLMLLADTVGDLTMSHVLNTTFLFIGLVKKLRQTSLMQ